MLALSDHDRAVLNCVFNPHIPLEEAYDEEIPLTLKDEEDTTPEVERTKLLEVEAVKKADAGYFKEAINILTEAIAVTPQRASLFNNRAQVHRLQGNSLDALSDLTTAIELSKRQGKTGCQALCQRALLHRKAGRAELAREDFTAAAKLGSQFAKTQLVQMNPYAALCNQMLHQVFQNQFSSGSNGK